MTKTATDWIAIEADYRAGIKPLRLIGSEHGVSHVAINKRSKRDGWTRDLKAQIQAKAEAKVTKSAVTTAVTALRLVTEQQVVEANAELQYRVRMESREDVTRLERLTRSLLCELEAQTDDPLLFTTLGELLDRSGPDAAGKWKSDKRQELYEKVISASWRIDAAKKLVEMTEKLIKLKYQVFGIEDGAERIGIEDWLKALA